MATKSSYEHGQFSWVDLMSTGMTEAKDFYGKVFGWKASDEDTQGGPPYAQFRLEGQVLGGLGELNDAMKTQGVPPCWNSYINVDDVKATVAKAEQLGGTTTVPVMQILDSGWLAFIRDPTGGNVGLWQKNQHAGAEVVNEPGAFCWNELATRDLGKAREFYGALLGWEFAKHDASPVDYYIINNRDQPNGGMLMIGADWADVPPYWAVYFAVANTDATMQAATQAGGSPLGPPLDTPAGRMAVIRDAQGAVFSVIQPAAT